MAMLSGWRLTRAGISFVIVIVVLAGLVTGAVFLVRGRGEQVRRDEAVQIAEQNLKNESKDVVALNDTTAAEAEAEATAKAAQDAAKAADEAATSAPNELPQTGVVGDLGRVLIVTILATSVAFYVSSRRAAQQG